MGRASHRYGAISDLQRQSNENSGQYLVLSEEEAYKLDDPVAIKGTYLAE